MSPLLFALLCLAFTSSHLANAQTCLEENQITTDVPLQLTDLVRLLTVRIPESCGEFSPLQLLPCRGELNVISGCCVSPCMNLFAQYSQECLLDLTEVLCSNVLTAPAVLILNSIASRCDDDYTPLTCGADVILTVEAEACGCAPDLDLEELEHLVNQLEEAGNDDDSDKDDPFREICKLFNGRLPDNGQYSMPAGLGFAVII